MGEPNKELDLDKSVQAKQPKAAKAPKAPKEPKAPKVSKKPEANVIKVREYKNIELPAVTEEGIKGFRQKLKVQRQATSKYSKEILNGAIISTTNSKPNIQEYVIELSNVKNDIQVERVSLKF
ncbi:ABC transporter ATP-binding protein [Spiroplasma clarkii]|nr:hypothetical protein [Spiroplasma clarkii]ARU90900.1 ABC transporter ATP-binding protein [Spiroplasma clarkii]